jgi:hypothetical protein
MKKVLLAILIVVLTIPASWYLFGHGYFIMHDDLQVMRVYEMGRCFVDGQIPCRWAPDMAYGYGQAMFNFYSAFPYYLGQLIKMVFPLSILGTVKSLFFVSIIASAVGMYLLGKEFWGRLGGVLSAVSYVYAPYHALDIFVRGALAESFALALIPFLWLFFYRLVIKPNFKNIALSSVFLAFLLSTHNISSLIYAPFTLLWVGFWIVYARAWKSIPRVALAGLLGVGMSAFFLLPAIFEQSLVQIGNLVSDYSDFHAHFVTLTQLFIQRTWGFGPSIFGPYDDLSFQIGWPHWWLAVPATIMGLYWFAKKNVKGLVVVGLVGLFLFSAFLTHEKSLFIWENTPLISFVQFPWRFLGLSIFFLSFALGSLAVPKRTLRKFIIFLLVVVIIVMNLSYFTPKAFSRQIKDEDKLTGVGWELQEKAAILDYLPKTAQVAPPAPAPDEPKLVNGEGTISNYLGQSNRFSFDADIYSDALVAIPVMYFPNWIVIVDNQLAPYEINGAHGVVAVSLMPGKHIVRGRFTNTPIRFIANWITVISILLLISGLIISENKKHVKKA